MMKRKKEKNSIGYEERHWRILLYILITSTQKTATHIKLNERRKEKKLIITDWLTEWNEWVNNKKATTTSTKK